MSLAPFAPAARRALRLLAAFAAFVIVVLGLNRWHALRELQVESARTEALGLRLDLAALERRYTPEALAALDEADRVCRVIEDAAFDRDLDEERAGAVDGIGTDDLLAEEAVRSLGPLLGAAERFLAADVRDLPEAESFADSEWCMRPYEERLADIDGAGRPATAPLTRFSLVEALCGAAMVAIHARDPHEGWRRLALAAHVAATARETHMTGVTYANMMLARLRRAYDAACSAAPGDPGRAQVRAALLDLDLAHEARTALRRDAAFILHFSAEPRRFGLGYTLAGRLLSSDVRDRAALHALWADVLAAVAASSAETTRAELLAIEGRAKRRSMSHMPITCLVAPRVRSFWDSTLTSEADLKTLRAP
ncbi:MAG: hypothetical protein R3F49_13420 [Planctomycetota bacterium]